jgi:hypothetical protein
MMGYGSTGKASGLKGTGYKQVSTPNLSPEQMQLFQQLLGGSQGGIGAGLENLSGLAGGGQSQFEQLEAPAMRQFQGLQGQLASRFSGMGSGARRSSGFQNASSGAATDLAERLQGQRLGLQQSAISQLLGLSNSLLGTSLSDNFLIPKKKSFLQELLGGLSGGLGQAGGSLAGLYGANKFGLMG